MDWSMAALLAGAGTGRGHQRAGGRRDAHHLPCHGRGGLPPVIANASSAVAISATSWPRWPTAKTCPRPIAASGCCPWRRRWAARWAPSSCWRSRRPISSCRAGAHCLRHAAVRLCAASASLERAPARAQAQDRARASYQSRWHRCMGILRRRARRHPDRGDIDHRPRQPARHQVAEEPAGHLRHAAAIVIFIAQGSVHWPATLCMLAGALLGGYLGGYLIRVLPAQAVRLFVIVTGAAMTIIYARVTGSRPPHPLLATIPRA